MLCSKFAILAAAALASMPSARAAEGKAEAHAAAGARVLSTLVRESAEANAALMRGDINRYNELIQLSDDFLLMSPFGGEPTRASDYTPERIEAMGRFFRNGTFEQEVLESYVSPDMVVLATIERANVEVGGLPPQDWALRVTLVYLRDNSGWRLAHRHADPLAHGITLQGAATLGRGDTALPK